MRAFDIIGDLHGYASKLEKLLGVLGYTLRGGVYVHTSRKVLFVGDYIDRGPEIRKTLGIVRSMVEAGMAQAVLGNHEFNALAYHTKVGKAEWLRSHSEESTRQHLRTIEQIVEPHPTEWKGWLEWFSGLPMSLDLGDLRIVHAAWSQAAVRALGPPQPITRERLVEYCDLDAPAGKARQYLLSGIKIDLPDGIFVNGLSGRLRGYVRAKWWKEEGAVTYREMAFPPLASVPDIAIPDDLLPEERTTYLSSEPPIFFGHYWMPGDSNPQPMAANIACLDYSIAAGGALVAYRWTGERFLEQRNFVAIE